MDSAAPVTLAAIAGRTSTLKLGTAVTVLSTQDPVRVYNEFATLDAVSEGRAQLIVGRGSAIESFPLYGFDLNDYEQLFEEKLDLLMRLLRDQPVTWSGRFRPPLVDQVLEPPVAAGSIPVWVGVGGSPQSAVRAARFGLPLMLGIIGGTVERFVPIVNLYRQVLEALEQEPQPVGLHVHGFIADSDEEAVERFWPVWSEMMNAEAPKRGWAPFRRDRFDAEVLAGSLVVGSPETVARRVAAAMTAADATRFDFVAAASRMPHADKRENIERFGLEVVPASASSSRSPCDRIRGEAMTGTTTLAPLPEGEPDTARLDIRRVAVIGAGRVGTAVARVLIDAGYEVTLSSSGNPDTIAAISSIVAPAAFRCRPKMRSPTPISSSWPYRCTASRSWIRRFSRDISSSTRRIIGLLSTASSAGSTMRRRAPVRPCSGCSLRRESSRLSITSATTTSSLIAVHAHTPGASAWPWQATTPSPWAWSRSSSTASDTTR
ncbi:LLM class flavin-dependent oxidoreductase [Microbacterium sp. NIBRBAC000506063]|uniref:LLM class flavin-dependent oxidoreductase n=1 Tax=Microbacterium sp. NIBRBAC000506063 TaxID=2734618 RepID=UPI001CB724E6